MTNAIVHGYPESGGPIEVAANVVGRQLEVVVRDRGAGIQPRPLTDEETSLRVGLALIGALSDQFIVRGEEGVGTELRMSFDLDRLARDEVAQKEPGSFAEPAETEAQIAIRGAEVGGAAIPKVLEMMVARADLSIERLSDAHLIGDFLSRWSSEMTVDGNPLEMSVRDGQGRVEIKIGPLEPGVAARKLARQRVPRARQHARADHRPRRGLRDRHQRRAGGIPGARAARRLTTHQLALAG